MYKKFLTMAVLLATGLFGLAGCGQTNVSLIERDAPYQGMDVKEPDFIVVTKVAVTPDQTRNLATLRPKSAAEHVPTSDETRIGNAFASALQTELVRAITKEGIRAYPENSAPAGSFKTGVVLGYCMQGGAGSSAGSVGFQLVDDHFQVRVIFNIKEVPVNGVTVDVKTRLRDDMTDEKLNTVANEEAKMVADKIVHELLVPAYKKRGWKM